MIVLPLRDINTVTHITTTISIQITYAVITTITTLIVTVAFRLCRGRNNDVLCVCCVWGYRGSHRTTQVFLFPDGR